MIAWENKFRNHCSRENNSQAILQSFKNMVSITRTARWTRRAPFNLFYYAQYCNVIKACVYRKITSLHFFRLLFSCIFISSKPAKFLDLLIHPQVRNMVIFGEQYIFEVPQCVIPSFPITLVPRSVNILFSALRSLITWSSSPTIWRFQKEKIYICEDL